LGCANAVGDVIPPWFVLSVFPTESLADCVVDTNIRFARSETGFSNAEITVDWIKHLNHWSWKSSAKAQRAGLSLEKWFGCDEHLRVNIAAGSSFAVEEPPHSRPDDEKIYRLLAMDGFSGHISFNLIEYAFLFDIILCFLPPHSSHRLQPLDVGVFQPLKASHQRILREATRAGNLDFNRIDFINSIDQMMKEGFTKHNIMKGFEESGIYPPDVGRVMRKVVADRMRRGLPVAAPWAALLPHEDRFKRAINSTEALQQKYRHIFDADDNEELEHLRRVIAEGASLFSASVRASDEKRERLRAYANRRKRGAIVKPPGPFTTSVSFAEIKRANDEAQERYQIDSNKKEMRFLRKMAREEITTLKEKWKDNWKAAPAAPANGRSRKPTFEQWLETTGRGPEIWSLEETVADLTARITGKPDPFFIDLTRHGDPETRQVIELPAHSIGRFAICSGCLRAMTLLSSRSTGPSRLPPEAAIHLTTKMTVRACLHRRRQQHPHRRGCPLFVTRLVCRWRRWPRMPHWQRQPDHPPRCPRGVGSSCNR
jgi:hypothetical protein